MPADAEGPKEDMAPLLDLVMSHVPEPAVEDGDIIEIDIPGRSIRVALPDEELARRREAMEARGNSAWQPSAPGARRRPSRPFARRRSWTTSSRSRVRREVLMPRRRERRAVTHICVAFCVDDGVITQYMWCVRVMRATRRCFVLRRIVCERADGTDEGFVGRRQRMVESDDRRRCSTIRNREKMIL